MIRPILALFLLLAGCSGPGEAPRADPPNIVYILADDLGYGDLSCLNRESRITTPHLDRLASQGMIFTDAHSGSSVCTPTRYGILTGRYAWRTRLQEGVLEGFSPHLIDPKRMTVASLLRGHGYHTACIGKWHLGMDWPGKVDYTKPIANGPLANGFDSFFGISASLDMPPYIWIENDRTVGVPTTTKAFHRPGPAHADFEAIDVLPTITRRAADYIDRRAKEKRPFFLYFPLNAPHTPILPSPEFQGKSGLGKYGDFVLQVDATVGEILKALDRNGLADNTLVIFTSDNGFSPAAGLPALLKQGHNPNHVYRGMKADVFEGGHRVPFIVRWPGKLKAGTTSDQTVCLTDLLATVAGILGVTLPDDAGEDSVSFLSGRREATVHHSINGSFAIRLGTWKLELCADSGGWSDPKPGKADTTKLPPVQLYDLSQDIAERKNLQADHPAEVERLTLLMQRIIDGKPNDVPVAIRKAR